MLDLGAYLLAAAELAAITAALAFGAFRLRAAMLPGYRGAPARLAEAVLWVSSLLLVCETLGLLGLFEEVPLLVGAVGVGIVEGLVARLLAERLGVEAPPELPERPAYFGGR